MAERTQKGNKNWESYSDDDDMDNHMDEELSLEEGSRVRGSSSKRTMPEEKLVEKRLKERARRNGMASSIDIMRTLVPELIDAKKNYSQAKVVAIALAHMCHLQHENDSLRARLGMVPMLDEFRARQQRTKGSSGKGSKVSPKRETDSVRGRKRRRLDNDEGEGEDEDDVEAEEEEEADLDEDAVEAEAYSHVAQAIALQQDTDYVQPTEKRYIAGTHNATTSTPTKGKGGRPKKYNKTQQSPQPPPNVSDALSSAKSVVPFALADGLDSESDTTMSASMSLSNLNEHPTKQLYASFATMKKSRDEGANNNAMDLELVAESLVASPDLSPRTLHGEVEQDHQPRYHHHNNAQEESDNAFAADFDQQAAYAAPFGVVGGHEWESDAPTHAYDPFFVMH